MSLGTSLLVIYFGIAISLTYVLSTLGAYSVTLRRFAKVLPLGLFWPVLVIWILLTIVQNTLTRLTK